MNKNYAIIIGLLVVAVLGAWALSSRLNSSAVDPVVAQQFEWKIAQLATTTASPVPSARVVLSVAGVDVPMGTYEGACTPIDGAKIPLLEGEVSGVICTHEGKGQEIGIFADTTGALSLKRGVVVEPYAVAANRTDFVEVTKL